MKFLNDHSSGFTLLELMVAISVIGILSLIGVTSFVPSLQKGRDARRQGDLRSIQNALEQCFSLTAAQTYPALTAGSALSCGSPVSTIMQTVPADPQTKAAYTYTRNAANSLYCVCGKLENAVGNATSNTVAGTGVCTFGANCTTNLGCQYFCVQNKQ